MARNKTSPEASGNQRFSFIVNGERYRTDDQIMDGRGLCQAAGLYPASDHVLIQLMQPGSKSIGLDEEVDLGLPGREEFRVFESDRTYNFVGDDLGFEWGAGSINEAELRSIMRTPPNEVLILERQNEPDLEIAPGTSVELSGSGTEHIRSERRGYRIIVNAREEIVDYETASYEELVAIAFRPVPIGPDVLFTITYSKGPKANPKGTLPEGGSVSIKKGMIFVVTQTNRS